jgi:hypothetical protein
MKTIRAGLVALASFGLLAGCATPEQWQVWRSHSSHFASGQHATFSFRNQGPEVERLRPTDLEKASGESWWGKQLPVPPGQGAGS